MNRLMWALATAALLAATPAAAQDDDEGAASIGGTIGEAVRACLADPACMAATEEQTEGNEIERRMTTLGLPIHPCRAAALVGGSYALFADAYQAGREDLLPTQTDRINAVASHVSQFVSTIAMSQMLRMLGKWTQAHTIDCGMGAALAAQGFRTGRGDP